MLNIRSVQLPRESHSGPNVIEKTSDICKSLWCTGNPLIVSGNNTWKIAGKQVKDNLEDDDYQVKHILIDSASEDDVNKVYNNLEDISFVLGVGGGKVIDVSKLASAKANLPFISVPTTASHDGIASSLASITMNNGKKTSYPAQAPLGVIADTEIISAAPSIFLSAGCGDIVSNYTAILDWQLAHRLLNVKYSESASALSLLTSKLLIDSADAIKERLDGSARIVVKSLLSSGMAISIANSSRPASGSEHKFSHALDKLSKKHTLHGLQCGVGTIMMMHLHDGDWRFIRDALKKMNAPTTAQELGIDEETIIDALTMAHEIRPDRYTILGDRGLTRSAAKKLASTTGVI